MSELIECAHSPEELGLDEDDLWSFHEVDIEVAERVALLGSPCPLCGSTDACDFDPEGRALVHVVVDLEDGE